MMLGIIILSICVAIGWFFFWFQYPYKYGPRLDAPTWKILCVLFLGGPVLWFVLGIAILYFVVIEPFILPLYYKLIKWQIGLLSHRLSAQIGPLQATVSQQVITLTELKELQEANRKNIALMQKYKAFIPQKSSIKKFNLS